MKRKHFASRSVERKQIGNNRCSKNPNGDKIPIIWEDQANGQLTSKTKFEKITGYRMLKRMNAFSDEN